MTEAHSAWRSPVHFAPSCFEHGTPVRTVRSALQAESTAYARSPGVAPVFAVVRSSPTYPRIASRNSSSRIAAIT